MALFTKFGTRTNRDYKCVHLVSTIELCNGSGIVHFIAFNSKIVGYAVKVARFSELSARPLYCNRKPMSLAPDYVLLLSTPSSLQLLVTEIREATL
jgi:hypothetical protein